MRPRYGLSSIAAMQSGGLARKAKQFERTGARHGRAGEGGAGMEGNPKRSTTLRFDATVKRAAAEALAACGMTLTQGIEEYLEQTA